MYPRWARTGPLSNLQTMDGFKIICLNAKRLKAFSYPQGNTSKKVCKILLFHNLVYSENYDIVRVCKTSLNSSVLNSEILKNFRTVLQRDRHGRVGGTGVLVVVI